MTTIPKQEQFFWLFPDTAKGVYMFGDFYPEYETRTMKKVPVFCVTGEDNQGRVGDFLITTWNVSNLNELRTQLGDNSDLWKGKLFEITPDGKGRLLMKLHVA